MRQGPLPQAGRGKETKGGGNSALFSSPGWFIGVTIVHEALLDNRRREGQRASPSVDSSAVQNMINALRNRFPQFDRRARSGLVFLACAAFYAIAGTVFASLIAWSLIVMGIVGIFVVSMVTGVMNDPENTFGLHSIVALGVFLLVMVLPTGIGFVLAPFVGVWLGWKSAALISIVMARSGRTPVCAAMPYGFPS
jgi:hypothetical protein